MLYIASDHGGYKLKDDLKKFFVKRGIEYADLGPDILDKNDDYPPYAARVAAEVARQPKTSIGLVICRSGQGVNIVANRGYFLCNRRIALSRHCSCTKLAGHCCEIWNALRHEFAQKPKYTFVNTREFLYLHNASRN
jgi:RpiB/LacA/LacB family sugar-phosphate isomerase